jgi:succinate dehydrogenase/fumarate reductase flavoprotein subunit
MNPKAISTDVLVIGGGLAGCFAAIKARSSGVDVVLVDKNHVGRTGCSIYASGMALFNPEWGDSLEDWLEQYTRVGEYIVDRSWAKILLRDSYARHRDMVDWGVTYYKKDGEVGTLKPDEEPDRPLWLKSKYRNKCTLAMFGSKDKMLKARKTVEDTGARIIDRLMITDLIQTKHKITGAIGFHTRTGDPYIIKAKATVFASGMVSFKGSGFGRQLCTGDGQGMAYRAGAEMKSMEWGGLMYCIKDCDTVIVDGPEWEEDKNKDNVTNAYGETFLGQEGNPGTVTLVLWPLQVHAGKGPIYHEPYGVDRTKYVKEIIEYEKKSEGPWITMLDRAELDIFNDRLEQFTGYVGARPGGGIKINERCETSLKGLYAAGDASGCGLGGAAYPAGGTGMNKAAVTGYIAGMNAAEYAKKMEPTQTEDEEIEAMVKTVKAPLDRAGGFTSDHVTTRLQQTIFPYEVHMVMHEKRLQSALTMVQFFRDHFIPSMKASDLHDLRKVHETRNMVQCAEMLLRTSLVREESRGTFYREDYPERDDENWLKWILFRKDGDDMKIWMEPVPEDSVGDQSMPYEERYALKYRR